MKGRKYVAEIADILQADKPEGSSQIVLFIPSRDRGDQKVDQEYWVNEGLLVIGQAFRGGIALSAGKRRVA